jgi:RNA polymerase sigma-70 factor (ECF subfamily)
LRPLEDEARRVRNGEVAAFEDIVRATSAQLVRVAVRIVGDMAEAQDVVQDSYVSAFRSLSDGLFEGRASVPTWLRSIVVNRAIDAVRSRKRRPRLDDSQVEVSWQGAASMESRTALLEMEQWMDALTPDQRAALVLSAMEGMSNAEIAQAMGCTEGAVEQRLVRARVALRQRSRGQ